MNLQSLLKLVVGIFGGDCKLKREHFSPAIVDYLFFLFSFIGTLSKVMYFRIISVIVSSEHISSAYVEGIMACVI